MKPIEINDFLNYDSLSSLNFSPTGSSAAFIVTAPDEKNNSYKKDLWLYRDGALSQLTFDVPVSSYIWDSDDTILYSVVTSKERYHKCAGECTVFYRLNTDGSPAEYTFTIPLNVMSVKKIPGTALSPALADYLVTASCDANYPDYYRMSEAERIALEKSKEEGDDCQVIDEIPFRFNGTGFINKKRMRLFLFKGFSGELTPLTGPLFNVTESAVTDKCIIFAGNEYDSIDSMKSSLYHYDLRTGKCDLLDFVPEIGIADIEEMQDKFIITGTTQERYGINENYSFYMLDPAAGTFSLLSDPDVYIGNCLGTDIRYGAVRTFKSYGGQLYFTITGPVSVQLWRLSEDGEISKVITACGSVEDFDIFGDTILLIGLYDMKPQELYRASFEAPEPLKLSDFNTKALEDRYVASPEQVDFSCHGVDMNGWVLKPFGFDESKTYPAILEVHGGPRTTYGPTFIHEMQVLASSGFFVFFCNPEGSGGSNEFSDLRGKYGTIDYEDIMCFTDTVLEKYPQIDPGRLGMTGGSYGGFMANWIIGHTDRFAAVVSQRSISNWFIFWFYSDIGPWFCHDQTLADPYSVGGAKKMWDVSPIKYVANATTPTLFIHSDEDYRCGLPEGISMFSALKEHGVPTKLCCFKGENHELSRSGKPKNRIRRISEILSWMAEYTAE